MARLKQSTSSWHQGLEALPRMRRLVDPDLTSEEYQDLLRRFYRANLVCERHLMARAAVWESRGLDWSSRLGKTAWLEEDLQRLNLDWRPSAPESPLAGARVTVQTPSPQPSPAGGEGIRESVACSAEAFPGFEGSEQIRARVPISASREYPALRPYSGEGFARAAGCLYVLEGATLGSRVILGLLGRAWKRPAGDATRFFQGYGPLTGERWAALGRDLQAHLGQDEEALNQALIAAAETYAFLGRILGDGEVPWVAGAAGEERP